MRMVFSLAFSLSGYADTDVRVKPAHGARQSPHRNRLPVFVMFVYPFRVEHFAALNA
jgi:hypothetical protein